MWPFNLSVRLPIVDLVGRYPANYLIGRESILQRIAPLIAEPCDPAISCGISVRFQTLSPSEGQVTHALLTRPPLTYDQHARLFFLVVLLTLFCVKRSPSLPSASCFRAALRAAGLFLPASKAFRVSRKSVRLACVRHAASVRPEPGSNSLKYDIKAAFRLFQSISELNRSFDASASLYCFVAEEYPQVFIKTYQKNLRVPCLFRCLIFKVRCLLKKGRFVSYHIIAALSTPFFSLSGFSPALC